MARCYFIFSATIFSLLISCPPFLRLNNSPTTKQALYTHIDDQNRGTISIVRWYTRRIYILAAAAVIITQRLVFSQGSPLTLISETKSSAQDSSPPRILEQSEGRELGLGQGRARLRSIKSWTNHRLSKFISNAVEKVLYQDNRAQLHNEAGDINDVGEEGHASVDINSENQDYGTEDLADEMDDRMGWAEGATATTTAGIQERELDDG